MIITKTYLVVNRLEQSTFSTNIWHVVNIFFKEIFFIVALQQYRVVVHEEQVVIGNDVLLKCVIPSFEADFVFVGSWVDSEGVEYPVNYELGNNTSD